MLWCDVRVVSTWNINWFTLMGATAAVRVRMHRGGRLIWTLTSAKNKQFNICAIRRLYLLVRNTVRNSHKRNKWKQYISATRPVWGKCTHQVSMPPSERECSRIGTSHSLTKFSILFYLFDFAWATRSSKSSCPMKHVVCALCTQSTTRTVNVKRYTIRFDTFDAMHDTLCAVYGMLKQQQPLTRNSFFFWCVVYFFVCCEFCDTTIVMTNWIFDFLSSFFICRRILCFLFVEFIENTENSDQSEGTWTWRKSPLLHHNSEWEK